MHNRRDELLLIAIEAIRADGASVSMQQIAHRGQVTKPTLYRAFESKYLSLIHI